MTADVTAELGQLIAYLAQYNDWTTEQAAAYLQGELVGEKAPIRIMGPLS
jgi:hypothetical protein